VAVRAVGGNSRGNKLRGETVVNINQEVEEFEKWNGHVECIICKRTYKNILEYKIEYLKYIDELIKKIEENKQRIKTIKGFTQEKNIFIDNIHAEMLNMNIDEFMENKTKIITSEERFQIIYNFLVKYKPQLNKKMTVKNIIEIYKGESENIKELDELNKELGDLAEFRGKVEGSTFSFRKIQKYNIFNKLFTHKEYHENIFRELMFKHLPEKLYKIEEDIIALCPFCQELFNSEGDGIFSGRSVCNARIDERQIF
jgi:hypothetical protein